MTVESNYAPGVRDAGHLVGQVRVSVEMRMFDRLPRSLQDVLRSAPVPIMAVSVMDAYLNTDERRAMRALVTTILNVAPSARPIRLRPGSRLRRQVPESEAYVVPRARGRRRTR